MMRHSSISLGLSALACICLSSSGFSESVPLRVQVSQLTRASCQNMAAKCATTNGTATGEREGIVLVILQNPWCGDRKHRKRPGSKCGPIGRCNHHGVCCPVDNTRDSIVCLRS